MIKKEYYRTREDGVNLYRSYSDLELPIRQIETGIEYDEAIDVEGADYHYEEVENKELNNYGK